MSLIFYFLVLAIGIGFFLAPQYFIESLYNKHNITKETLPGNGEQLARHLLEDFKIEDISVEKSNLPNHYSPETRKIFLKEDIFDRRSLTSVSVAVHEFAHVLQHRKGEKLFRLVIILAKFSGILGQVASGALLLIPVVGILTRNPYSAVFMIFLWAIASATSILFQLINLINEWDASFKKALPILKQGNYLSDEELTIVKKLLRAAALTYLAKALRNVLLNSQFLRIFKR